MTLYILFVPIPFHRELRIKQNLDWIDNDTVVDYDLNITYIFEPSMSVGDPMEDTIITLNIPLYVSGSSDLKMCPY